MGGRVWPRHTYWQIYQSATLRVFTENLLSGVPGEVVQEDTPHQRNSWGKHSMRNCPRRGTVSQNYYKTAPNCARVITHREMPCAASYLHCRRCQKSTRTKQNSFPLLGSLCHRLRIKLNIMPTYLQGKNMFQYHKHYNEGGFGTEGQYVENW